MNGKVRKYRWGDGKKKVIFNISFIFLITSIILSLSAISSAKSSGEIVYVATDGSGNFNCNGTADQVEINKALAYVAENPQFTTVHLKGPNVYVISGSIFVGSNTILEGDSTAVIKLKNKAGWREEKSLITQMDSSGNHNISIRGFEIDGNHDKNSERDRGKGYYNLIYFLNSENIGRPFLSG